MNRTSLHIPPINIPAKSAVTVDGISVSAFGQEVIVKNGAKTLTLTAEAGDRPSKLEHMQENGWKDPLRCDNPTQLDVECKIKPDKGTANIAVVVSEYQSRNPAGEPIGGVIVIRVEDQYNKQDAPQEFNDSVVTITWSKLVGHEGTP